MPLLAVFIAAGCIATGEATDAPTTPVSSPSAAPSTEPTVESTPTAEPAATAVPTVAPTPDPIPTESATSATPTPSAGTGSEAACTGTDDNRKFFAAVAASVDWPVYCPSLPARWSVDSGQYRLAGGGWMKIAYKGPSGARIELSEGAFCDQGDGCVPAGSDAGSAAFGNLSGTLVTGNDGRYAVVVDRGANRSWLAVGVGLDLEVFKGFAADLVLVD